MMPKEEPDLQLDASGATVTIDPATATVIVRDGRFQRILSFDEALLLEPLAENPDRFSFPSGHTAAAFAVAVAFAGEPGGLGPLALLLATGIGLSRVYLGAHYPLDVAAGGMLGVFAGLAARLLVS